MMNFKLNLTRKKIYGIIITGLIALAALNAISWFFLQSLESNLTDELKNQILHVGQITARLVDGNQIEKIAPGMENSPLVLYYQQLLYDIKINNELENIVIMDPIGRLLIDYRLNYLIGDTLFTFPLPLLTFNQAAVGDVPDPVLTRSGEQYFMSAYLPILNDFDEPVAVLVIDAPLKFFATLQKFESGSLYLAFGGLAILVIFSLLTLAATRRLFHIEDRMKEQERLAELGQMAASVAHEIRNPLSIMKGTAELLQRKYREDSDEMLSFIPEEIDRLNRLVDDFLQFARHKQIRLQPVNLNEILPEFVTQLGDRRVTLQTGAPLPQVKADLHALKQILLNLVQNALDAVGKDDGRVILNTVQQSRRIQIRIKDNGSGITKKNITRIFDPFFSTKASGSGLGLAISKQLVEQMGGDIVVESQPEKGSIVKIILKTA